jgi:cation diffusion facilitator CzcD-associated flavoprotein CzcO
MNAPSRAVDANAVSAIDADVDVDENDVDIVIVGAGISGIGAARALLRAGHRSLVILERAASIGGTWRDNTYPGVAVDIPSAAYQFADTPAFPWSRTFAPGHEVLAYVKGVAVDVDAYVRCGVAVDHAAFDVDADRWVLSCSDGRTRRARVLIAATGLFTTPVVPPFPGRERFAGPAFHSARWQHDVDVRGKRVAVIGTGASAAQIVPALAPTVAALHVCQRTPIWIAPRFDLALGAPRMRRFAAWRALERFVVDVGIGVLTAAITAYRRAPWLVHVVQALVRTWMNRQVNDPATRAALVPTYTLGCKRPTPSNTYLKAFNRPHVSLITTPIAALDERGIVFADGARVDVDVVVYATGFLTTERGTGPAFPVVGKHGRSLDDVFDAERLQSYRGVAVPGFPNFFLTGGPYAGGFNWFDALDACVGQIVACLAECQRRGVRVVEVDVDAHAAWMAEMWRAAEGTVFLSAGCAGSRSYYTDRHGDAALPLPHTPAWRRRQLRGRETAGFTFRA